MSIESRVEKLEQATGGGASCVCRNPTEVRRYFGPDAEAEAALDERPAAACGVCGLPKQLINVIYVKQGICVKRWRNEP